MLLIYLQRSFKISNVPEIKNFDYIISSLSSVNDDTKYQFTTPQGQLTPFSIGWIKGEGLVISGYIIENKLSEYGIIVIGVPDELHQEATVVVIQNIAKRNTDITTAFLTNGVKSNELVFKGVSVDILSQYVVPGRQIVAYIDLDEEKAKKVINSALKKGYIVASPISHIIIGKYTNL